MRDTDVKLKAELQLHYQVFCICFTKRSCVYLLHAAVSPHLSLADVSVAVTAICLI